MQKRVVRNTVNAVYGSHSHTFFLKCNTAKIKYFLDFELTKTYKICLLAVTVLFSCAVTLCHLVLIDLTVIPSSAKFNARVQLCGSNVHKHSSCA